eukprot:1159929-Pelagomonas_calceolata.AAC.5
MPGLQEGRVLGKALGETLEAASKSLFSSMKRSAVEWREQQQQQQQPPQASRGFTAAGNASNTNSRGSSFFGAIASAAVGFIDATVPADTPSKQATPSQHGSSGGAHVRTQSRSAAQPGTSNSAAGVAAAQSAEQQQEQEQLQQQDRPCPGQQEDLLAGTAVPGHSSVPASASTAAPQAAEAEPTLAAPPDPHTAQAEPTVAAPPDPQTAQAEPTVAAPPNPQTAQAEPTVAAPPNPHATQDAVPFHTSSTTDPSLTDAPPPPTNPDGSLDTVALDPQTQHLLQACADMDAADAKADAAQHPGTDTTAAAVEAAAAAAPPSAATPGCHEAGQQQQQQQRQQQQQEQLHHLYNPGVLHYIKRDGGCECTPLVLFIALREIVGAGSDTLTAKDVASKESLQDKYQECQLLCSSKADQDGQASSMLGPFLTLISQGRETSQAALYIGEASPFWHGGDIEIRVGS